MKIEYDSKHDVMNIEFLKDARIVESTEIDGMIFDYSEGRKIVSVEILDAGKRITKDPLETIDFAVVRA